MQKISIPPVEELKDLLFNQLLSKKKVAKYYNVSVTTVFSWMREYNLVGLTPPKLQAKKRALTNSTKPKTYDFNDLLKRAINGEIIKVPGFNSEYLEEYLEDSTV